MKNLALPLLMFFLTAHSFMAQTKSFLDVPYLETSALVEAYVSPDKIYLSITIEEKDSKGRTSVEEQENKMAQRLKSLGIDIDRQLTIKDLASNYKKYFLRSKEVLKSKQFSLLVYDGLTAGKVLAALEDIGIANTYLEKTEYSKMESLKLELKSKAILKAKEKANALVEPLGQELGPAIHIVDVTAPSWSPRNMASANMMLTVERADDVPLDIGFEKIKVESSVNVKFKLSN